MAYHLMYYMRVTRGKEEEFKEAWQEFTQDVRAKFKTYGSVIFKTPGNDHVVIAVWPSQEAWESFWVTKEITIESLTRLKSCLDAPSTPVKLDLIHSNWPHSPFANE